MKNVLRKLFITVATRINNPMVHDEFFVPKLGLEVRDYIDKGDRTGSHHLLRYEWVINSLPTLGPANTILDIACGAGYGSYMTACKFPESQVIGVDYDPLAVKTAQKTYQLKNLQFKLGDMTRWEETIGPSTFDRIISFDTLEHISHREIAFENLVNHMAKDGCLFFSTPCGHETNDLHPIWAYHKIEFSSASLYDFLKRYFKTVIAPDDQQFPHRDTFDKLKGSKVAYLLQMNPVICRDPIQINNPYRK